MTDLPDPAGASAAVVHPLEVELDEVAGGERSRLKSWSLRGIVLTACLLGAYVVVRLVGEIDWSAVGDAFANLHWWQIAVLVVILVARQVFNALPLAFFIPGLSVYRAVVNDLASHLLAVIAPPPGDMVLRVGMFTSWGIEASRAIAGTLMNMIAFYMMRFSVPIVGFLILLPVRFDSAYAVSAAVGLGVGGSIVGIVFLGLRSERFAEKTGRISGSLASKVKKSVDPDRWAAATVRFRDSMKETFAAGFPKAAIGLLGLVVSDATVLLLSLRFVDVSASQMPAIELYAAFLCAYPLTLFPFMGLGIFDAVLLAAVVDTAGLQTEPAAVAALLVWRAITLAGPILLGAVSLGLWKHSVGGR